MSFVRRIQIADEMLKVVQLSGYKLQITVKEKKKRKDKKRKDHFMSEKENYWRHYLITFLGENPFSLKDYFFISVYFEINLTTFSCHFCPFLFLLILRSYYLYNTSIFQNNFVLNFIYLFT